MEAAQEPNHAMKMHMALSLEDLERVYDRLKDLIESGKIEVSFEVMETLPLPPYPQKEVREALEQIEKVGGLKNLDLDDWHRWKDSQP